jgi:alkylated DNA repair dioxygenase AlkB
MDLFPPSSQDNLLPYDGVVNDYGDLIPQTDADTIFLRLLNEVPWQQDEVVMFGKRILTERQVAWYGDKGFSYAYSGTTKHAIPWTDLLLYLKQQVEESCGESFNSCLLNLYAHGQQGMGWHSDDEQTLLKDAAIASLSLGAERRFCFKHKRTGDRVETALKHGSLLVMRGSTQRHWLHNVPKSARVKDPRINLTFRQFLTN